MIADAVKSRGRSRHGHLAAGAMTVAKSSGRRHTPTACSGREAFSGHPLAAADGNASGSVGSNQIVAARPTRGDDATIVFDRHNLIFAYGPLELFEWELQLSGAREGEPAVLRAHVHHYHADWDDAERGVLRRFEWRITPLRPSDVQFDPEGDRNK
jgi:hypothetical protein